MACGSFLHLQSQQQGSSPSYIAFCKPFFCLPFRDTCDYTRPACIIQVKLPISRSLTLTTSAKSVFNLKVIYSEVPRNRAPKYLGSLFCPPHNPYKYTNVFPLDNHCICVCNSHCVTYIKKMCSQWAKFNKLSNFYWSIKDILKWPCTFLLTVNSWCWQIEWLLVKFGAPHWFMLSHQFHLHCFQTSGTNGNIVKRTHYILTLWWK